VAGPGTYYYYGSVLYLSNLLATNINYNTISDIQIAFVYASSEVFYIA
jgi:hypothetical protein